MKDLRHQLERSAGSAGNAKKIAIYGSGYIALEFAGIFNGLEREPI